MDSIKLGIQIATVVIGIYIYGAIWKYFADRLSDMDDDASPSIICRLDDINGITFLQEGPQKRLCRANVYDCKRHSSRRRLYALAQRKEIENND